MNKPTKKGIKKGGSRRQSKTDIDISKHKKDIISKYTSGLFRDATLEFYGIKAAKIKEPVNIEFPRLEIAMKKADFIFLLEDDTYQHLEFETSYKKTNLIRFADYDVQIYKKYKKKVQTVIIYSSEVKKAAKSLDIGSLKYTPDVVMMCDYDGNAIYAELERKLQAKETLTDTDMLNLIFLPLLRSDIPKYELAEKSIELAKTIEDETKQDTCIASTVAFMERYLTNDEINKILEVVKMTRVANLLIQEAVEEAVKETENKKAVEIAISLLDVLNVETIAAKTKLTVEKVNELKEEYLKNKS